MHGDKRVIKESHIRRSEIITAELLPLLKGKDVLAFAGPSGTGKSEISSLVGTMLKAPSRGVYVLSCDNYPHRPPTENDAHRTAVFEAGGKDLLSAYLGSQAEIDFERLGRIVAAFKSGQEIIPLRIMNTTPGSHRVEDDARKVDFSKIDLLILEGTWSHRVAGIDHKIFLEPPPEGTKAHRAERARDAHNTFIEEVVLPLEEAQLRTLASAADYVVFPSGELRKRSA